MDLTVAVMTRAVEITALPVVRKVRWVSGKNNYPLFYISVDSTRTMSELQEAGRTISQLLPPDWGIIYEP